MSADHPANAVARAWRQSLPAHNTFDIATLAEMPPYWGWVEGHADEQASFRMFLGGNDDGVALRLLWNGSYERTTLALWSKLARRTNLALDIGAHSGIYTLAARAANPAINILSFEPHAQNYARLTLNLRANDLTTTDAYPLGVSAATAQRPFTIRTHPDYLSSGGTFERTGDGITTDIRVVALDSFLPEPVAAEAGLIKIDVEGHEGACFAGMRKLIARARPTFVFECVHEASARAVHEALAPLGYRFFEIDDHADSVNETDALHPVLNDDGSPVMARLNRIAVNRAADAAIVLPR